VRAELDELERREGQGRRIPLFVYGESLGGGVTCYAAERSPRLFDGLVLFAPMLGIDPQLIPAKPVRMIGE
jgi:acylglycerol lipase